MKIMYFAWMREHTGTAREDLDLPDGITTVAGLVDHLRSTSPGHARALSDMTVVRVAVNQENSSLDAPISGADEIAFFPPVTGG